MNSQFYIEPDKVNKIERYVTLLKKYQRHFNLIGNSTINNIWVRHVVDSAQIFRLLPQEKSNASLIDVGSGAGFPGIILAIMGRNDVLLCEKSRKKVDFLNEVIENCKIRASIINNRVENLNQNNCSIIVSRAFSSLKKLIKSTIHLIKKDTTLVLHKGKKYKEEIAEVNKRYSFKAEYYNSITSDEGKIIKLKNIKIK